MSTCSVWRSCTSQEAQASRCKSLVERRSFRYNTDLGQETIWRTLYCTLHRDLLMEQSQSARMVGWTNSVLSQRRGNLISPLRNHRSQLSHLDSIVLTITFHKLLNLDFKSYDNFQIRNFNFSDYVGSKCEKTSQCDIIN